VEVKDNGSGLQQGTSKQVDKKSMALRLTRKRLELLSHQMGGHFGFTVKDRGTNGEGSSGVYVHLTLPLIRY
jgi:predicted cupin superfamily sugar epimerase